MKRTVYIETTIPSFYHDVRNEPAMIARRASMRQWWEEEAPAYDLVASAFVLGELGQGDCPGQADAIRLIGNVPLLEIVPDIEEIAGAYVQRRLMPSGDLGDAYHLAVASYTQLTFFLRGIVATWPMRTSCSICELSTPNSACTFLS